MHEHIKQDEEFDEEDRKLPVRINKILDTNEKKTHIIETLLGTGGVMTLFINEILPKEEIPMIVKYCMAMTAGNLMNFMLGHTKPYVMDLSPEYEDLGEHKEERIYRKMKMVVESLYQYLKKNERELEEMYKK